MCFDRLKEFQCLAKIKVMGADIKATGADIKAVGADIKAMGANSRQWLRRRLPTWKIFFLRPNTRPSCAEIVALLIETTL